VVNLKRPYRITLAASRCHAQPVLKVEVEEIDLPLGTTLRKTVPVLQKRDEFGSVDASFFDFGSGQQLPAAHDFAAKMSVGNEAFCDLRHGATPLAEFFGSQTT